MIYLLLFCLLFIKPDAIPEYTVFRTQTALSIDGVLDEQEWQAAKYTEAFVLYRDGHPAEKQTRCKILWDEKYIYIGFQSADENVAATYNKHDSNLWDQDVNEVFCDPQGDGLNYFEFQVNPLGTTFDLFMPENRQADRGWNFDYVRTAVKINGTLNDSTDTDNSWSSEIAIPFREISFMTQNKSFPPKDGDSWRMLLCRYNYPKDLAQKPEISAWNKTDKRGFHAPDKFGKITFSTKSVTN
ncbi:MAG: carbohydrate-binding family 9-like protein [Calditrichae bacterium]|nr:carbohydrate-binding family 9-like protein [Calditrichota bacterium]MCB9058531.1 carbohydrate-binding family 9-like protein [Calditrichia bacterium]